MERLLFPYSTYTDPPQSLFPGKIKTGFIYMINTTEEQTTERGYVEMILRRIFGDSEYICSFDTYQFDDYSEVVSDCFDPEKKAQRRKEIFPKDCEKASKWAALVLR